MKLYSCCFSESEIYSQIVTQSGGNKDYCKYNNRQLSEYADLDEFRDLFISFFSLFDKETKSCSSDLLSIIERDWRLLNPELPQKSQFLDDLLIELKIDLSSSSPVVYKEDIVSCISSWERVKESLQERRRYFPEYTPETEGWEGWGLWHDCQITLEKGFLYRARINPRDRQDAPLAVEEMGPPEKSIAVAGRANPQGIPFLYLCQDEKTTAYETRAMLLDRISVGCFEIERPLKLVDFTAKFDPFIEESTDGIAKIAKQMLLFRTIANDMSRPIRRHSSQIEYIPTQYICEYIRHKTEADGVLFKSSIRATGENIVLFNNLDKVKCIHVKLYEVTKNKIEWEALL